MSEVLEGHKIIGIKKTKSKDGSRTYTSYMCMCPWTDYELDKSELYGSAVEEVQTTEDFPIELGDVVKFYYGKAIGSWQPVTDYKLIEKSTPFDKVVPKEK